MASDSQGFEAFFMGANPGEIARRFSSQNSHSGNLDPIAIAES
jgi:hypothetical protein